MHLRKQGLRKVMLAARDSLNPDIRSQASSVAQNNLLASEIWAESSSIGLYMAIRSEASTSLLLEAGLGQGKSIWLPRLTDQGARKMQFSRCQSVSELVPGRWDIPEPKPGSAPDQLDLVLMPGLAFDRKGHRLGYGAGYYDRFFQSHPKLNPVCIGFCLACQIVPDVPAESWDKPVAALCSEKGLQWL